MRNCAQHTAFLLLQMSKNEFLKRKKITQNISILALDFVNSVEIKKKTGTNIHPKK